ncbi:hypothetical protein K435DRAFT_79281 [Dendrothele bispora CBS 962.96]|uniref:DUF6533 domain-containing protein n=1 Tax=Dendrothele bispora (strain CBS 962.96) TaxID=1314807 RepID=A0A4S8M476_DENBC|nr:hypothetical protein K435DRAFT_79281 [Dendrothele bispora CBS 962.96]
MSSLAGLFSPEVIDSVLSARYLSAVALVSVVYDHFITFDQELKNIWGSNSSTGRGYLHKVTFVLNRYVASSVSAYTAFVLSGDGKGLLDDQVSPCRRFIWVFTMVATIFIGVTQFIIILRVYHLWDKRRSMTVILFLGFLISFSAATVLAVITVIKVQPVTHFFPFVNTCGFLEIPKTLPYVLGSLLLFDLFLIVMAIFNALETPHDTHAEVFERLHRDGARLFLVLFILRLITLIMSVVGNPADTFAVLSVVWSLNSVLISRIHLRVEGLRFLNFGVGKSFLIM